MELPAYSTAPASMHVLYPSRPDLPVRTRAVLSFLLQDFHSLVALRSPLALRDLRAAPKRCGLPANTEIRFRDPEQRSMRSKSCYH